MCTSNVLVLVARNKSCYVCGKENYLKRVVLLIFVTHFRMIKWYHILVKKLFLFYFYTMYFYNL